MSDHLKGVLITTAGVIIITPDALLLRIIEADVWTILFWRGAGFFLVQWLIVFTRYGRNCVRVLFQSGWIGLAITAIMSVSQVLFVSSIINTHVANTLVIIAASPLLAAALAYLALGERVAVRTIIVGVIALFCVGITVSGGLTFGGFWGDMAAIGAMACLAIFFTMVRGVRHKDMLPCISVSGLITAVIAYFASDTIIPPAGDIPWLLILCLFVSPVSFAMISAGPRYLPAPEVNLLLLLETVLGPLWVWMALAEIPSTQTLVGGAVLLAALSANALLGLRAAKRTAAAIST